MGKAESFEFQDMGKYSSESDINNGSKKAGCFVSTVTGFILTLLAACLAVGVGLIVHFASQGKGFECKCTYPGTDSGNSGAVVGGTTTLKPVIPSVQQCQDLISGGSLEICNVCPDISSPISSTTKGTTVTTSITTVPPSVVDVRLPKSLKPQLYTVELQPNMYDGPPEQFTFNGSVKILMTCIEPTSNITLHINKLNLTGAITVTADDTSEASLAYSRHVFDTERQFVIVEVNRALIPGKNYTIMMTFIGPLKDDLHGLYLSSYNRGNETIYIATTQFQATDLRKTFPCFDEPAIKAKFNITLVRKSHMVALSNMPRLNSEERFLTTSFFAPTDARKMMPCFDEPGIKAKFDVTLLRKRSFTSLFNTPRILTVERGDNWVADIFDTTPPVSTYLLAFIISDFNYTSNRTANDILYRAWARPEAVDQTTYALDVGVSVLTYFEEYFNISFPLPKQDMIAIPDFAAGAMENWGLITYRETAMLYDPKESSEGNKQRVAVVVSHELAHQWFGNLVTPSWWDDLWLNEGFASFVEYMGVDHYHPDWKMFEQFVVEDLQDVFNFDGLVTSHPVYVPVSHPSEISEIFDRISYGKGASIIRMMRFFLGEETFKRGLTRYLMSREYDAAFHDDLWYSLGNQSIVEGKNVNVKQIMDTWTLQMNYPVVIIKKSGSNFEVTQKRYLQDYSAKDPGKYPSPFSYLWEIPITMTHKSEVYFNQTDLDVFMMPKQATSFISKPVPETDWIIGNVMQYGYYRVNYEDENWNRLINQLDTDHKVIHSINRAQIINDAWNLAKSGDLKMEIALKTVNYLDKEREYVPWEAALKELGYVDSMLERTSLYGSFSKFMKDKVETTYNETQLNEDSVSHLDSYVRSIIAARACKYGVQSCIDASKDLFQSWMDDPHNNPINPSVRSTVYCTAIRFGGVEEWDFAYQMYKDSNLASEKSRLMASLSCSDETWILSRYLEYSIIPTEIRKQDATNVIVYISQNAVGRALAWDFVRGKWDLLLNEFGSNLFNWANFITSIPSKFNTYFELEQLETFLAENPDMGSGSRAFQQAIEKTKTNIKWMDTNYQTVHEWLKGLGY